MMKFIFAFTTICTCALTAANLPQTFTGVITDTMCRTKHGMRKDQPDDQCIRMCTKGSYLYALFDGTNVLRLSDQKMPAKYPAQKVKVTGTLDEKTKTIRVSSIEPVDSK